MVFILGTWYLNLRVLRLHAGEVCCKRTRQKRGKKRVQDKSASAFPGSLRMGRKSGATIHVDSGLPNISFFLNRKLRSFTQGVLFAWLPPQQARHAGFVTCRCPPLFCWNLFFQLIPFLFVQYFNKFFLHYKREKTFWSFVPIDWCKRIELYTTCTGTTAIQKLGWVQYSKAQSQCSHCNICHLFDDFFDDKKSLESFLEGLTLRLRCEQDTLVFCCQF